MQSISNDCVARITREIESVSESGGEKLDEFYRSSFSEKLAVRIKQMKRVEHPLVEKLLKEDVLDNVGKKVANYAVADGKANGLRRFAGGDAHQLVKDIGKFINYKFRPWEAVKVTKGINVAGKLLSVFGIALSAGMQLKADREAERRAQEMKRGRESVRAGFSQAAQGVSKNFRQALANLLEENYVAPIRRIDDKLAEIGKMRAGRSATYDRLAAFQQECRSLISDIHRSHEEQTKSARGAMEKEEFPPSLAK